MRIVVVGAGVGGLACAIRLARAGHQVTVLERAATPGGKCSRVRREGFVWDAGPSLLTMPHVFEALFAETGAPLRDELELLRVEPVTRYGFADGSVLELSADLPRALEALESWSAGSGRDWLRFLGTCASMWRASVPFLEGPAPWPPRRPMAGAPPPDPRDLARVRPWWTLRQLAKAQIRDPRLRMVVERFATYAGADPARAPAALAVAGFVEHVFGAWHPRGGVYELVRALERRLEALGGRLCLGADVQRVVVANGRVAAVEAGGRRVPADAVVSNADAEALRRGLLEDAGPRRRSPSLSGLALMLGLRGRTSGLAHHTISFPARYGEEFADIFDRGAPARDPAIYTCAPSVTDPGDAPDGCEAWFVLVNAPAVGDAADWDAAERRVIERLGIGERVIVAARRTPGDLERETGAVGGAIYGAAPHGRLASLRRPGNAVPGVAGLWQVGGTVHPGGGLPLVALGARTVAQEIGPA